MSAAAFARTLLAAVLLLAAVGKLRHGLPRFVTALEQFGIGGSGSRAAVFILAMETAAGVLLISPWPEAGSIMAAGLMASFSYFISSTLARGGRFACGCFGSVVRITVSPTLLGADLALLGLAIFLVADVLVPSWSPTWTRLWIVVAASLVVGGSLQAARVRVSKGKTGLLPGARAPRLTARTASGGRVDIEELAARGCLILFVSPHCTPCRRLLRSLAESGPWRVPVLFVASTPGDELRLLVERHGCDPRWTTGGLDGLRLQSRFRITGVPAAVRLVQGTVLATKVPADERFVHDAVGGADLADGVRASSWPEPA